MPSFDCLGDPIRRRILGLRANGGRATGEFSLLVLDEFEVSRLGEPRSVCRRCVASEVTFSRPPASEV